MKKKLLILFLSILLSVVCYGQPNVAAPTPTLNVSQVISIFGDAYTNLAGTNFNPDWGQATVESEVTIAGKKTLEYASLNYQGTSLGTTLDLSSMGYLHLDYWSSNLSALTFNLVSYVSINSASYTLSVPTTGWTSVDIPLSAFLATNFNITKVYQFMFNNGSGGTVYIENIYFWANVVAPNNDATLSNLKVGGTTITGFLPLIPTYYDTLAAGTTIAPAITATCTETGAKAVITNPTSLPGTATVVVTAPDGTTTKTYSVVFTLVASAPTVAASTPTVAASNVISIFSDTYTNMTGTNLNPNWGQVTVESTITIAGVNTLEFTNLNYQGINLGSTGGSAQDISSISYLHVDFWTSNASAPLQVQLVSKSKGASVQYSCAITQNTWISVDIPLSYYTTIPLTDIYQLEFSGLNSNPDGTFYLENIYFWTNANDIKQLNVLSNNDLSVYPNPAENNLYFASKTTLSKVAIFNLDGKQVKEYDNVLKSIDVSDLKTGDYIMRLTDTNGKTVTSKFIKK